MSDPYKDIRGVLGAGSHLETAAGSGAGLISLDEAMRMGVDVSDLVESGTTDTTDPSVLDPKNQHTTVGVRMPGAAKPPADVRPQTGYKDGQMIGVVTATIKPVHGSQKKGSLPDYELTWVGQRVYPDGLKQTFGSESEAKKFASGGESVKWYRPANPDPWESMDAETYAEAVQALVEGDKNKYDRCVKSVEADNREEGKPAEGTNGDNPFAICHASTGESQQTENEEKYTVGTLVKYGGRTMEVESTQPHPDGTRQVLRDLQGGPKVTTVLDMDPQFEGVEAWGGWNAEPHDPAENPFAGRHPDPLSFGESQNRGLKVPTILIDEALNEFYFLDQDGEVVDYEAAWPAYESGYYQAVEEVARKLLRKSLEELGIDEGTLREYHAQKMTPEAVVSMAGSEQGVQPSRRALKRHRPDQHGFQGQTSEWDTPQAGSQ